MIPESRNMFHSHTHFLVTSFQGWLSAREKERKRRWLSATEKERKRKEEKKTDEKCRNRGMKRQGGKEGRREGGRDGGKEKKTVSSQPELGRNKNMWIDRCTHRPPSLPPSLPPPLPPFVNITRTFFFAVLC